AGGILISDSYSYANPGKNDLIVKGNVGIGITTPQAKLHVLGQTRTNVLQVDGGADFAENFDVSVALSTIHQAVAPQVEPGMVVSIDLHNPGRLMLSQRAYDRRVAGI